MKVEIALNPSIGGLPQTGESENTGLGGGFDSGTLANSGPRRIDYYLSMDMAKELSMVEANAKGKQARDYFIACETKLKEERTLQMGNYHERLAKLEAVPQLWKAKNLMEAKAERDLRDSKKLHERSEKLRREYGTHYTRFMNKIEKLVERVNKRTSYKHVELIQVLALLADHARFDEDGEIIPG